MGSTPPDESGKNLAISLTTTDWATATAKDIIEMKRLIFCFDGTWNKLDPALATNVVLTAASIERVGADGVVQIIHYDEGVGTSEFEKVRGGAFGMGLTTNLREAYRFLIFNYDPGDEIFAFGFSRGAFSARSFIGLIRHAGPLSRLHAGRIDEAIELYRDRKDSKKDSDAMRQFRADYSGGVCIDADDDVFRCKNVEGYEIGAAPQMMIKYLGIWDTVGAMGWPNLVSKVKLDELLNKEQQFHDVTVDGFIASARHAVAIDEDRKLFPSVSIGDLTALNRAADADETDKDAPYQERWFPGVHGAVGGGGDIRGLSDGALAWVLQGAKQCGLHLDTNAGTRIHNFKPDPYAPIDNESDPKWSITDLLDEDREGPTHIWQLSSSAIRRWRAPKTRLGGNLYRPRSLDRVKAELDVMPEMDFNPPENLIATIIVQPRDTLSHYAHRFYGDNDLWPIIFEANLDVLDDAGEIFPGQPIRIPAISKS